eukprot:5168105-Pyramimonas_sp.AAC.1
MYTGGVCQVGTFGLGEETDRKQTRRRANERRSTSRQQKENVTMLSPLLQQPRCHRSKLALRGRLCLPSLTYSSSVMNTLYKPCKNELFITQLYIAVHAALHRGPWPSETL